MRRCVSCKSAVRPDDRFCARCGAPQPREAITPEGVQPRWTLELNHAKWFSAHPAGRIVAVGVEAGARDRLSGYAQDSGELVWSYPAEDAGTEPLLADRTGFLVLSGDRVVRYAADSGEVVWSTPLEGRGPAVARLRVDSPVSLLVARQGAGAHEMRAWTLDALTGAAREVADHVALEAMARRRLVGLGDSSCHPECLPRVGADAWVRNGSALFSVAVVREAPATTGAARSVGLLVAVDVLTREPAVATARAAGIPLSAGQVHYADTDEGEVLVWASSGGLVVLPLDGKLDPIRFEVPGLVRLAAVSGRQVIVEVSGASGAPSVLALTLPFGKPVWQNPSEVPCTVLGLDDSGRALFVRSRPSRSVVEFRPRDHGFRRVYDLPEEQAEEPRGRERVAPGPVTLVTAGRNLLLAQIRERASSLCAFARDADDLVLKPVHRNLTSS